MPRPAPRHRRDAPHPRQPYIIGLGLGLVLISVGGYAMYAPRVASTYAAPPPVVQDQVLGPGARPVETPPKKSCAYEVAPNEPRRLVIDDVDVNACVQRVGVDAENRIGAPVNVHVAGWFTGSSRPGQRGLSILDGHNRGAYSDGVFLDLHELRAGGTISVELGDGTSVEYRVRSVEIYPQEETMQSLYRDADPYDEALGIITCSGDWDTDAETRADRVVVVATPA